MADTVTVQSVIDGARSRIMDAGGDVSDNTDILIYIRDAWKHLYSLYIGAEPDRFRTEATISFAAAYQSVPVDWLATIAVDYQQSAGVRSPLRRLQEADRNAFLTGNGPATAYRIIGNDLFLYPPPTNGGTYIHIYIPTAPAIASAATTIEVRGGDDGYLQKKVAKDLLMKEEAYDGRYDKEIEKLEEDLVEKAALRYMRDANEMRPDDASHWYDEGDYRRWFR